MYICLLSRLRLSEGYGGAGLSESDDIITGDSDNCRVSDPHQRGDQDRGQPRQVRVQPLAALLH